MTTRKAYTVKEARALIGGISQAAFYKLVNAGELKTVKIAGRRLVPDESINELIQRSMNADHPQAA